MKMISTRTHGMLDYTMGILLIISPWLFNFAAVSGAAVWVPLILGIGVILYSLFTNYEYGVVRVLTMRTHLWLDGLGGAILALSPWIFGFAEFVFLPHLLLGIAEIGAAMMTQTVPKITPVKPKAI